MLPGPFNPPPLIRDADTSAPERPPAPDTRRYDNAYLRVFAITFAAVVGFLGLLIAGAEFPSAARPLRMLALVWFVAFGVWHARASIRPR